MRRRMWASSRRVIVAGIVLGFLFLSACTTKPTLVVCVGGLGYSQLGDLRRAVTAQCPEAKVVNAGGWDGYKADLKKIATAKPRQHIVFIGHSFGCGAIDDAASQLPKVDLAVFIDPAWNDFRLSGNILQYLWYRRSGIGIERQAKIIGASSPRVVKGGHNDIPHSQELIAEVVQAIKGVETKPAAVAAAPVAGPAPVGAVTRRVQPAQPVVETTRETPAPQESRGGNYSAAMGSPF